MTFSVGHGSFAYGTVPVLRDISFQVEGGQVMCVLGPNGVGKTTLLRCMMGLLPWQQGESRIDDTPLLRMKHTEIWRRIAYVPQTKGTALAYTAAEMVLMGRSARLGVFSQPTEEDRMCAAAAMEQVGVCHLAEKRCCEMSGGELQMVLIARALSADPELLVLDEPESNLDFKNQLIILETIRRLSRERGIAAIVNTHYPAHALKIAQRALLLYRDGHSVYGSAAEVISEENMQRAFQVQVKIVEYYDQNACYKNVIPISVV